MYTIDELIAISGTAVIGASILVWCCKMQWDQRAIGKMVKEWKSLADDNKEKNQHIESKVEIVEAKCELMCALVMDDVKNRRHDLFEHHSPLQPTETARAMVPDDIMGALKSYNGNGGGDQCMLKAIHISQTVSIERLNAAAREKGLSLLEFMAIITDVEVPHE
ncbi:MAG: hypothetical protein PHO67_07725 [Candidatus Omnitrophica bacterium]|nr:hypothetical protein [Candidatus Omnitrophota bacterium]